MNVSIIAFLEGDFFLCALLLSESQEIERAYIDARYEARDSHWF